MGSVTQILSAIEQGDPQAADKLLPLVYEELRKLAAQRLGQEKPADAPSDGLGPRSLPSPGRSERRSNWNSRGHFFAAAAEAMRRILVEAARRKASVKHGGDRQRVDLDSACSTTEPLSLDVLALDEALTKLAMRRTAKAELVKLRFFAGLTMPEAAAALGISLATAERYWTFARSWLYAELNDDTRPPPRENL